MSSKKQPIPETGEGYITRKYIEYRKLLDEALDAKALSSPTLNEGVEPIPNGGFQSVIKVNFVIQEWKLHEYRESQKHSSERVQ